jgi:CubicO group peptidase (beta-lactamase class C family)
VRDDKASEYISEWAGTDSESITIANLISNDSGRHWDFDTSTNQLLHDAVRG